MSISDEAWGERRGRLQAWVGLILSGVPGVVGGLKGSAAWPDDWAERGEVAYLYRHRTLLVRDAAVDRVKDVIPSVSVEHGNSLRGLIRLELTDDTSRSVEEACAAIDQELGPGVATPDHVLYLCPATEPEVMPADAPPDPGVSTETGAGDGVFVAVLDTGLLPGADYDHAWLRGVSGEPENPTAGYPSRILPYACQGTFAAGVLRATAPGAEVWVDNAFPAVGAIYEFDLVNRLPDAVKRGARILSLSFGTYSREDNPLLSFEVLKEWLQSYPDIVLVAAAGNDAIRNPFWPAAFPWVVSVGAIGADRRSRASFSNYGATVDVFAPGEGLVNAYAAGPYLCTMPPNEGEWRNFQGMARWSGTSFAVPLVAGLIAARMSRTAENGRAAADSLLRAAQAQAIPGVGPVLFASEPEGRTTPDPENVASHEAAPGDQTPVGAHPSKARSDRQPRAPTPPPHAPTPPPGAAATGQSVGVVPDRLPPAGDALVWREAELEHLLSILRRAGRRGRKRPPIVVVTGEPGMGKTSLAVHSAHRLRDHFPDGTLFIALGGASRPDTVRALRTALQDLEPEQPSETELADAAASLEQLASRYRTAFSGRRILVLVDDALEARDAEPFIPPVPSSALVVTSPSPLRLPNAQLLTLSPLQNDEVAERLKQVLETRGVELSDELLARVMAVTAGNPLAVSLAEAILREAPPQQVMLSLEAEQRAIEEASSLVADDIPEDVRESYRMLDSEAQRLFRLLGLLPNPDFETGFAAALLDTGESIARERLDPLIDADLVSLSENGRYSLPAPARAAARYQCRTEEPPSECRVAAVRAVRWLIDHPQGDLLGDEHGEAERTGAWRAGYASDTVLSGLNDPLEDHLGMEQEVEAISWVVAATDIDPPLSVGLFGDWGTGKSYFMRLMEQCVKQIKATALHEHEAGRDFPACSHIRQITFNAWHYVDANLWASLVTHIFEELAKREPESPQAEQEVENLLKRLQTTQVLRREAEEKKKAAGEEKRRRTSELEKVKRRRMAQVKDLRRGQVDRKDLLLDEEIRDRAATLAEETPAAARRHAQETTAADLPEDLAKIADDQSFLRQIVELIPDEETRSKQLAFVNNDAVRAGLSRLAADPDKVRQLAQLAGDPQFRKKAVALIPGEQRQKDVADLAAQVTEIYTDVIALRQVAADVRTTWGKLGYSWETLRDRKSWKQKRFVIPAIILAVGIGLSAFFITSQGWTLKGILTVLASVGAYLGVAVPLVRDLVSRVKRTVDLAADAMDDSARRQIASLEAQEAQLQREIEEARRLELEAERELEDIRRGRRLYQYIQERASSTDYQQYLGVIALIRKDFERLAELMDEGRRAREGKVNNRAKEAGNEIQAAGNAEADGQEQSSDNLPQIDRIILYIDDLDRCPAKRVVEVLEAIHLLLALKLFVVVVGVDSRWLVRSLQRHYQAQLSADEGIVPQRQDDWAYWDTTPQNYLEKIFQIVFSIRSMDRTGYESLLDVLFPGTRSGSVNVEKSKGSINRTQKEPEATPASAPAGIQPVLADEGADLAKPADDALTDLADPLVSSEETPSTPALPKAVAARAAEARTPPLAPYAEDAGGDQATDAGSLTTVQTEEPKEQGNAEGRNAVRGLQPRQLATPPREALQITSQELHFMKRLVLFVPTPRSAKRLANTYRLMRVLVTADEAPSFRPGRDDTGDYKIALTLLAILVGFPNQAPLMFRQLLEAENTNWPAFRVRLAAERVETDRINADGKAKPKRSGKNDRPDSPARRTDRYERGQPDQDEPEAWERLLQYLDKLTTEAGLPEKLGPYQYWCRRAARFSFQTGRLAAIIRMENEVPPTGNEARGR
jgi:hypothetical protein